MKKTFKHKATEPHVDRVLKDFARTDPSGVSTFPRPVEEIITLCYPLAIHEVSHLDRARAHAEVAKIWSSFAEANLGDGKLAGCLFVSGNEGVILVERDDTIEERQRFTEAHELGHFVIEVLPTLERNTGTQDLFGASELRRGFFRTECTPEDVARNDQRAGRGFLNEVRANLFAAELLMPAEEVQAQLHEIGRAKAQSARKDVVRMLSRHFGVSPMAMKVRLADLGAVEGAGEPTLWRET